MTEETILQHLFARLPAPSPAVVVPPGDDCAALRLGTGRLLLVAVDQVVADRHFRLAGSAAATPEQAGRKLLARNLSDIAAMGGRPTCCLVAPALGPGLNETWIQRFFAGILELAAAWGVDMIGGDLAATPASTVAALTILGDVDPNRICRRSGAQPGDGLYATGCFGAALRTRHHLTFTPRCREGQWLAASGAVHAMIDVSDGLLLDAGRLCRASGVALRLDPDAIPRRTPDTTLTEALTDGEDYELIAAIARARETEVRRAWPFAPTPLTRVGEFVAAEAPVVTDKHGRTFSELEQNGYDHFGTVRGDQDHGDHSHT